MAMVNVDEFAPTASLFPVKLYRMVCDTQCQCMSWGGEGEHLVLNTRAFEDELLQQTMARWKYQLKTTSTTSFIRQLHAYGFRKVVEGFGEPNNIRRYYHPYFHRQRPDLLMFMKRSIRSSGVKKHPLRIIEESSKQAVLMTSMLKQGISPFEKLSLPAGSSSPQIKLESANLNEGETSTKRRRKAPPRKHPSFEESGEWAEEDFSNPSMITRSRYKEVHTRHGCYPMLTMGGDRGPNNSMTLVKEESKSVMLALQNAFPNQSKQFKPSAEISAFGYLQKGDNVFGLKQLPPYSFTDSSTVIKMPPNYSSDAFNLASNSAAFEEKHVKKESPSKDMEEPLDLSHSKNAKTTFIEKPATPVSTKHVKVTNYPSQNAPFDAQAQEQRRQQLPNFANRRSSTEQTLNQPCGGAGFLANGTNSYQMPTPISRSKILNSGLPPFPAHNARFNVPPHAILQPAYIAWPTRGIFCPQTKQWIQARPTIIPLPFNNQQAVQSKNEPQQQLQQPGHKSSSTGLGVPGPQMLWYHDTSKVSQDMKEMVIKTEDGSRGSEETAVPPQDESHV